MNDITVRKNSPPAKPDIGLQIKAAARLSAELVFRHDREAIAAATRLLASVEELGAAVESLARPATRREIGQHLAALVGSFPLNRDGEIFGRLLVEDVAATAPSIGALERACTRLRRTSKFLPSISEVLEAVRTEERKLGSDALDIEQLPKRYHDAIESNAIQAKRDADQLRQLLADRERRLDDGKDVSLLDRMVKDLRMRTDFNEGRG
jgi:hypothetical protein